MGENMNAALMGFYKEAKGKAKYMRKQREAAEAARAAATPEPPRRSYVDGADLRRQMSEVDARQRNHQRSAASSSPVAGATPREFVSLSPTSLGRVPAALGRPALSTAPPAAAPAAAASAAQTAPTPADRQAGAERSAGNKKIGLGVAGATTALGLALGARHLHKRRQERKRQESEMSEGKNVEAALMGFYKYAEDGEDDPAPKRPRGVLRQMGRGAAVGGAIGGAGGALYGAGEQAVRDRRSGYEFDGREVGINAAHGAIGGTVLGAGAGAAHGLYRGFKNKRRYKRELAEHQARQAEGKNVEAALMGFYKYAEDGEDDPAPKKPRGVLRQMARSGAMGGAIGGAGGALYGAGEQAVRDRRSGYEFDGREVGINAAHGAIGGTVLGTGAGLADGLYRGLRNKGKYKRELAEHQARQAEGKTTEAALSILFGD